MIIYEGEQVKSLAGFAQNVTVHKLTCEEDSEAQLPPYRPRKACDALALARIATRVWHSAAAAAAAVAARSAREAEALPFAVKL